MVLCRESPKSSELIFYSTFFLCAWKSLMQEENFLYVEKPFSTPKWSIECQTKRILFQKRFSPWIFLKKSKWKRNKKIILLTLLNIFLHFLLKYFCSWTNTMTAKHKKYHVLNILNMSNFIKTFSFFFLAENIAKNLFVSSFVSWLDVNDFMGSKSFYWGSEVVVGLWICSEIF